MALFQAVSEWHPRGCGFKHQSKHLRGIRCMSSMKVFAARSTFHREDVHAYVVSDVPGIEHTSILCERCCLYLIHNNQRDMESLWFGPWKYLRNEEWSDNQDLDATLEEIKNHQTKDELVNERSFKVVIEGVQNNFQEEVMAKLKLNNGFFIGMPTSDDDTSRPHLPGILKHIRKVLENKNEKLCRNPVIFVLDNDIQMLPIENMPLLTKQEIYHMPFVGGIIWTIFQRERSTEDKMVVDPPHQMIIDPRDCYYLIYTNFKDTISCFDKWSKTYNFKGCCMDWSKSWEIQETLGVDKLSELREELKTRNLFLYMGHGDGGKLIQAEEIRKINSCGAVFLIGCITSCINFGKSCVPDDAPLDYLLASSPAIVANFWIVATGCMNLLTTELLQAWLDTKSAKSVDCNQAVHEKVEHNEYPNKRKALKLMALQVYVSLKGTWVHLS